MASMLALLVIATDELSGRARAARSLTRLLAGVAGIAGGVAICEAIGVIPGSFPLAGTAFNRAALGFGWPNELGMFFALSLPLCVYSYQSAEGNWTRTLAVVGVSGCVMGLLSTFSRGSWLAVLVAPVILVSTGGRHPRMRGWIFATLAVVLLDVAAGGAFSTRAINLISDDGVAQRAGLMVAGLLMFQDHPWVGVGPGGFEASLGQYGPTGSMALGLRRDSPQRVHRHRCRDGTLRPHHLPRVHGQHHGWTIPLHSESAAPFGYDAGRGELTPRAVMVLRHVLHGGVHGVALHTWTGPAHHARSGAGLLAGAERTPGPMIETENSRSAFDHLIPPEIADDRLFRWIVRIAATPGVRQVLEIGSSSGAGSTEAFVLGALRNPVRPVLHCLELSKVRFAALTARYRDRDFVRCYNLSSVPLASFPTPADLDAFRRRVWTRFRFIRRSTVLTWLQQDVEYLKSEGLSTPGIRLVREANKIDFFDAVLIDGSEFTGPADLDEVYGARFLILDDIKTYKNYDNYRRLRCDSGYRLLSSSWWLRNGFAVFSRDSLAGVPPAGTSVP